MKIFKKLLNGMVFLFICVFLYSGFLFYQNNPGLNPFTEGLDENKVVAEENLSDQKDGPRFTGNMAMNPNSFSYKPLPTYSYYRTKALTNPAFTDAQNEIRLSLNDFNESSRKMNYKNLTYNKDLDSYIRDYKEKQASK